MPPTPTLALLLSLLALALLSLPGSAPPPRFPAYLLLHSKQYPPQQLPFRHHIYLRNLQQIRLHNQRADAGVQSYYMGVNQFSDMTEQQFMATYLQADHLQEHGASVAVCTGNQWPATTTPAAHDWSAILNAPRDQGVCAAGYAITTVTTIQAAHCITTGMKLQLSVQQMLDCTAEAGNRGCIGGAPWQGYGYVKREGVTAENRYPYKGFAYGCQYKPSDKVLQILGCVKGTPLKQSALRTLVYHQPIAVSLNAGPLQKYSTGIYKSSLVQPCKHIANHWMLLVGYGVDAQSGKSYWKLQNSWGVGWGENGYVRVAREGDGEGECGVQMEPYYPQA